MPEPLILLGLTFSVAFMLSWGLGFWARKRGVFLDHGVPLVGGVAVAVALTAGLVVSGRFSFLSGDRAALMAAWGFLVLVFGLWDDWKSSSVLQKLLWQSWCAAGLLMSGIKPHIPFLGEIGNVILGFLWLVGLTNALNLLDVSDGVCAGVTLAACAGIGWLAFSAGSVDVMLMSWGLAAAVAGFFFFNRPPARIYLGNAGSHFLGFLLAALSLALAGDVPRVAMGMAILMVLWLPILETGCLIFFRLGKKINPWHKSEDHMALRLGALGFSRGQVLAAMAGFAIFFATAGVLVHRYYTFSLAWFMTASVSVASMAAVRFMLMTEEHGA